MGVEFDVFNLTKREWFAGAKRDTVILGEASRVLMYLMVDVTWGDSPIEGRWRGDHVVIVNDTSGESPDGRDWDDLVQSFTDITPLIKDDWDARFPDHKLTWAQWSDDGS